MQVDWQVIVLATAIPFVTGDDHGVSCLQRGRLEQQE